MKVIHFKWVLVTFILANLATASIVEARHGSSGHRGGDFGEVGKTGHFHPEKEHPNEQYRSNNMKNWQQGNGHGYTHNGAHYNYYHNGRYFNYYHSGQYYNYYNHGNYYNYYNNGLYYLFFFNGLYYNNCINVPHGYPNCP